MTAREDFDKIITDVTAFLAGRTLDQDLENVLNATYPADGATFASLMQACETGIAEGWLANREQGGIRFGRVIKPSPATNDYSVDVVLMDNVVGPNHRHTNGEIDVIMPLDDAAKFDGRGKGWLVYPAGHAHKPTVTGGKAIILYLLPGGAIEFT
jgi:hypothetical protein